MAFPDGCDGVAGIEDKRFVRGGRNPHGLPGLARYCLLEPDALHEDGVLDQAQKSGARADQRPPGLFFSETQKAVVEHPSVIVEESLKLDPFRAPDA